MSYGVLIYDKKIVWHVRNFSKTWICGKFICVFLVCFAAFKPKGSIRYFGWDSAHHPSIYVAWPLSYAGRLRSLSSSSHAFRGAITTLVHRLRQDFLQSKCNDFRPTSPVVRQRCRTFWVVIAYHPNFLHIPIASMLNTVVDRWQHHLTIALQCSAPVRVLISYSRAGRNIERFFRSEFNQ